MLSARGLRRRLRPMIADTSLMTTALKDGSASSSTGLTARSSTWITARIPSSPPPHRRGRCCRGSGNRTDARRLGHRGCEGVCDRVGAGPFPTEIEGPDQDRLRELGGEVGTVTGRTRRCGWLDLVGCATPSASTASRRWRSRSSTSSPPSPRFRLRALPAPGRHRDRGVPGAPERLHHCRPVYETLPGWQEPLDPRCQPRQPDRRAPRGYVAFVEAQLGVEVSLIGTGARARARAVRARCRSSRAS